MKGAVWVAGPEEMNVTGTIAVNMECTVTRQDIWLYLVFAPVFS